MKKQELIDFLDKHDACPPGREWALTQESLSDVYTNCERGDWLLWVLRKAGMVTQPLAVELACQFAERVLPIYEARHTSKAPRSAIAVARNWLLNPCDETRKAAAAAAYADDAADDASDTYAAYPDAAADAAAADAAAAAAAAAYADAATDAAAAAAAATDAAARAAADAAAERKAQADIIRTLVPNPWTNIDKEESK